MKENYVAPDRNLDAFNCPYCHAYAKVNWYVANFYSGGCNLGNLSTGIFIGECCRCHNITIWQNLDMIIPSNSIAPMPNDDMPKKIKDLYNEAREIANKSPKGAAAILRLALQYLCDDLIIGKKNINDKIAELVKKGLSTQLQKAFDIVRIVGNNAVHPGEINIDDNPKICFKLFDLINIIVDQMITKPKEIEDFYNKEIPKTAKNAITKRDSD